MESKCSYVWTYCAVWWSILLNNDCSSVLDIGPVLELWVSSLKNKNNNSYQYTKGTFQINLKIILLCTTRRCLINTCMFLWTIKALAKWSSMLDENVQYFASQVMSALFGLLIQYVVAWKLLIIINIITNNRDSIKILNISSNMVVILHQSMPRIGLDQNLYKSKVDTNSGKQTIAYTFNFSKKLETLFPVWATFSKHILVS